MLNGRVTEQDILIKQSSSMQSLLKIVNHSSKNWLAPWKCQNSRLWYLSGSMKLVTTTLLANFRPERFCWAFSQSSIVKNSIKICWKTTIAGLQTSFSIVWQKFKQLWKPPFQLLALQLLWLVLEFRGSWLPRTFHIPLWRRQGFLKQHVIIMHLHLIHKIKWHWVSHT